MVKHVLWPKVLLVNIKGGRRINSNRVAFGSKMDQVFSDRTAGRMRPCSVGKSEMCREQGRKTEVGSSLRQICVCSILGATRNPV